MLVFRGLMVSRVLLSSIHSSKSAAGRFAASLAILQKEPAKL